MDENTPTTPKKIILHLGDKIRHNDDIHRRLDSRFTIHCPEIWDRERPAFIQHLKDKTWGDFSAIMKPFWSTGGEMGNWDRELIELLPSEMKVMARAGAGYDSVDVDALAKKGILYCNGGSASTESVADSALWYIIAVFRQMTWSSNAARSGSPKDWREAHNEVPLRSHNPRGHRLAIVGLGNIGFAIAKKAKAACGMRIIYYDEYRKSKSQEKEVDAVFYNSLEELLPHADCLLIAIPTAPNGDPLLNASTLAKLPRGARIVNIARGNLVDEDDLVASLKSGHISAAGLDVHYNEPHVNTELARMSNVTMTCHTAGGSIETNIGFEKLAMENVEGVLLRGAEGAQTAVKQSQLKEPRGNGCGTNGELTHTQTEKHKMVHEIRSDSKRAEKANGILPSPRTATQGST